MVKVGSRKSEVGFRTKVLENKFGQVIEKPSDLILSLFGFVKATILRDSSEYSQCVQNVFYTNQKIFCRARKGLGTSLAQKSREIKEMHVDKRRQR